MAPTGLQITPKRKARLVAATPIDFVRSMVPACEKYGRDPSSALRSAQIRARLLKQPNGRITASQMEAISSLAKQELDDEALGFFTRRLPWGSYGMLCRASLTAPTLRVALSRWRRHHRILTDDISISLRTRNGNAELMIEECMDLGPLREFCLVTTLRSTLNYICWLGASLIATNEAQFAFAEPSYADVLSFLFPPGPVRFSAHHTGLIFEGRYLDSAPVRDEAAMSAMPQRALPLTIWKYRREQLLTQQVRQRLKGGLRTAVSLAAALHVSV